MTTRTLPARRTATWPTAVAVVVCLVLNLTTAIGLTFSRHGYVAFMTDDGSWSEAIPTLLAGLALGLLESTTLGLRRTVFGVLWTLGLLPLFGFWVLIVGPAVVVTAGGVAVGGLTGRYVLDRRVDPGRVGIGLAALLALGAVGYGCFSALNPPAEPPLLELRAAPNSPTIVVDVQDRVAGAGQFDGTLADVEGCLGLTGVSGVGRDVIVVWPRGSDSSTMPLSVVYRGERYRLGDRVRVVGTILDHTVDLDAYAPDLPASCRGVRLLL